MQIALNPKQGTSSGCFGFFFSNFLKTRIFPDIYFLTEEKRIIGIFLLHPFQPVPKSHISLTISSSEYLPTCNGRKRSSDPYKFPADQ